MQSSIGQKVIRLNNEKTEMKEVIEGSHSHSLILLLRDLI